MDDEKPLTGLRLVAFCGIISPIITFVLISLAIFNTSWFSWTENALSDLGVEGIEATLFNSGLILGGILYIPFALGIERFFRNQTLGKIGASILLLADVLLIAIGIFPETAPNKIHLYVSVGFFLSLALSLLIQGTAMIQTPAERKLGTFTMLIVIIGLAPWILHPWKGVAIPELIAALAATIWSCVMSMKLLRG